MFCLSAGDSSSRVKDTGFHMMNLLRRFVDIIRINSMDMNALTGNVFVHLTPAGVRLRSLTGGIRKLTKMT
jgi:hypothetical protein